MEYNISATLQDVTEIATDVKQFLFSCDEALTYEPGQHVVFELNVGDDVVHRPYTIVNNPGTSEICVAVKRYEDGTGSVAMHNLQRGDAVRLSEPKGNLYIRDYDVPVALVSTGTGATPMVPMLQDYLETGSNPIYYFHGERSEQSRLYVETIQLLEAEHDNLQVVWSLSDASWRGREGFIQSHIPDVVDDMTATDFYVCGVPEMVVETRTLLADHGVSDDHIIYEGWEDDAA